MAFTTQKQCVHVQLKTSILRSLVNIQIGRIEIITKQILSQHRNLYLWNMNEILKSQIRTLVSVKMVLFKSSNKTTFIQMCKSDESFSHQCQSRIHRTKPEKMGYSSQTPPSQAFIQVKCSIKATKNTNKANMAVLVTLSLFTSRK